MQEGLESKCPKFKQLVFKPRQSKCSNRRGSESKHLESKYPESKHSDPTRFLKGRFKCLMSFLISNNSFCNHIYKADVKINLPMNYIESDS